MLTMPSGAFFRFGCFGPFFIESFAGALLRNALNHGLRPGYLLPTDY